MRTVRGELRLPPDAAVGTAGLVLAEVRDVSMADAPSVVVAACRATDVSIGPGATVPFEIAVPDTAPGRILALRGHVSWDGTDSVSRGDAISTTHLPVPPTGDAEGLEVPLRVV